MPQLRLSWCGSPDETIEFTVHHTPTAPGWVRRIVAYHPEWLRHGPRGECNGLQQAETEPHHATLAATGWAGRLPYLSAAECDAPAVPWLSVGTPPPRSSIAFWGWNGSIATMEYGPLLVTAHGSMFSLQTGTAYVPHPEYHCAPSCLPRGAQHHARVINLEQAYSGNYWHLIAEILPRLLTV